MCCCDCEGNMSSSYPTPLYSHAGRGDFPDVYEPAEDSFLLIDALERDADTLQLMRSVITGGRDVFFIPVFPYFEPNNASFLLTGRVCVWRWAVDQE